LLNKLILANLAHRPVRTILSIVAIAVEVTIILTLVESAMELCMSLLVEPEARELTSPSSPWVIGSFFGKLRSNE